jgi:transaldolase
MATNGTTRLWRLRDLGQSVWLDFISRELLESGELRRLMDDDGLAGMTSNPTIFEKAIGESRDYDEQIAALTREGLDAQQVFERVAASDVQRACDVLRPVFDRSDGGDGFVSIEVSPRAAGDTEQTIREVRLLHDLVDRPNVMVKIPATPAGIPAIKRSVEAGFNINITLMFSMAHYEAVVEAFLSALEERRRRGEPIDHIASVASFFVSRVDTLADKEIDGRLDIAFGEERRRLEGLRGRLAVANSRLVYERFAEVFAGERWRRLAEAGGRVQRVLWASTSTKNPAYSDVLYVDELIGPETVTTLTKETMAAFDDHGRLERTVDRDLDEARRLFREAAAVGLDMGAITEQLQVDGVAAFARSYDSLLRGIEDKRRRSREEAA